MESTHSKTIGYILWIFGFTGAHRFYFGKPVSGLIWFLTFGLLGVGWLIDLFLIPGMERRAELRYKAGEVDYSAAWILLTFLGIFGAHRFYMGKWFTGILYLLTGYLPDRLGLRLLHPELADHRDQCGAREPRRANESPCRRLRLEPFQAKGGKDAFFAFPPTLFV